MSLPIECNECPGIKLLNLIAAEPSGTVLAADVLKITSVSQLASSHEDLTEQFRISMNVPCSKDITVTTESVALWLAYLQRSSTINLSNSTLFITDAEGQEHEEYASCKSDVFSSNHRNSKELLGKIN